MNVKTSNIFTIAITINWTTIDTATREPIVWTTIGGTAGTLGNITITNTTITIAFTFITITTTITIDTINNMTGKTSVIIKIVSDTGEVVSEFKSGIRARADGATSIHFIIITIISIPQTIIIHIRIVKVNNIPLRQVELAE